MRLVRNRRGAFSASARAGGFTLLEIVVAVAIIGILVGFALISLPRMGGEAALEEQARRLARLLELAMEEALLQGRDLGLHVELHGYSFHAFDADALNWVPLDYDDLFRERELPREIALELLVEGRIADLVPSGAERERLRGSAPDASLGSADGEDGNDSGSAGEDTTERTRVSDVRPQVLILASGELTPFTLIFESDASRERYVMTGQPYGAIELQAEETL
jgi:general secretion pathway protein H